MSRFKSRKIVAKRKEEFINMLLIILVFQIVENRVEQGEVDMENLKRMIESESD